MFQASQNGWLTAAATVKPKTQSYPKSAGNISSLAKLPTFTPTLNHHQLVCKLALLAGWDRPNVIAKHEFQACSELDSNPRLQVFMARKLTP